MAINIEGSRLDLAIKQTNDSLQLRKGMLNQSGTVVDLKRREFNYKYAQSLSDTAFVLRSLQDPSSCEPKRLLEIMIKSPGIVDCVRKYALGRIHHYSGLLSEVEKIAFRETYPFTEVP